MDKTINDYDNDGERLKQTPSASAYGVPSLTDAFGYGSLQNTNITFYCNNKN